MESTKTIYVAMCIAGDYEDRATYIIGSSFDRDLADQACKEFDKDHYDMTEADMPYSSDELRMIEDWLYDTEAEESGCPRIDPETGEILQMPEGYDLDLFNKSSDIEMILIEDWGKAFVTSVPFYA